MGLTFLARIFVWLCDMHEHTSIPIFKSVGDISEYKNCILLACFQLYFDFESRLYFKHILVKNLRLCLNLTSSEVVHGNDVIV